MKRPFSEVDSTNDQLETFRLKLEQMRKEIVAVSVEKTTLETELTALLKSYNTRVEEISNLKVLVANIKVSLATAENNLEAAERDLEDISSQYKRKEGRIGSIEKEMGEKEELIQNNSTIYNALNSHKKHLAGEFKPLSTNQVHIKQENKPIKKGPIPTIEVFMMKKDMPDMFSPEIESGTESSSDRDHRIKQRIKLMFELGEHPDTPEHEIAQSIRNAERLLKKHNLKREDINEMAENLDSVDGELPSVVKVTLRNVKSKKTVPMMEWYYRLAEALSLNFSVRYCYWNKQKQSIIGFYGSKSNAQMAAYMYKCVFTQIHLLSKVYKPDVVKDEVRNALEGAFTKGAFTRKMRLSYALGICIKLIQNIKNEQCEHDEKNKPKQEARSNKLKRAINRGDERIPEYRNRNGNIEGDSDGWEDVFDANRTETDSLPSSDEEETKKDQALTLVAKKEPELALKKAGIKMKKTTRYSAQNVLSVAVKDGKDDARKINLNRRQIANE